MALVYCNAGWAKPGGNRMEVQEEGEDVEATKALDVGNRRGDAGEKASARDGATVVAGQRP